MELRIVVLPGDGVGPEVTAQAVRVLREVASIHGHSFRFAEYIVGGAAIREKGSPLPPDTLNACLAADAVLLGAIGSPEFDHLPANEKPEAGLLGLRMSTSAEGTASRLLRGPGLARAMSAALALWTIMSSGTLASGIAQQHDGAWIAVATAAALLLAALASSIAGFAFSAIAGCALAYLGTEPIHAVQTMVLCSIATQSYAVWKIRESIDWRSLWPMVVTGAATIPFGVWLLVHVDAPVYAASLGAFLTIYACYLVLRRKEHVVRAPSATSWPTTCGATPGATFCKFRLVLTHQACRSLCRRSRAGSVSG